MNPIVYSFIIILSYPILSRLCVLPHASMFVSDRTAFGYGEILAALLNFSKTHVFSHSYVKPATKNFLNIFYNINYPKPALEMYFG